MQATCTIDECDKPTSCRSMCQKHYTRWLRHGSPLAVFGGSEARGEAHHGWSRNVTYRAVHKRLTRFRGPASDYACADCGAPALHWSYNHGCTQEKVSPDGAAYSSNLDAYSPRCNSCHKLLDAPGAPECPQGHPFAGANLIIRKDGSRCCRTCKLRWDREQYQKRKAIAAQDALADLINPLESSDPSETMSA